jgi:hypothetical protein
VEYTSSALFDALVLQSDGSLAVPDGGGPVCQTNL